MLTGRTDFDVTKGRLQNHGYFQGVTAFIASPQTMIDVAMLYVKTLICSVATLILHVKVGPACADENRL